MPLLHQINISEDTKLAIWQIAEDEPFFKNKVPLKKEITHPHKRLQHLAGRYLLPILFSDFPYEEILIADNKKPYLKNEAYHFSISHCDNYAAAIVSKSKRVGIDIETYSDKVRRVSNKFLNDAELNFTNQFADSTQILTTLWNAKEAAYKWYSFGKVDFKKNILIQPFSLISEGKMQARFCKDDFDVSFEINYKHYSNLSLAWIVA